MTAEALTRINTEIISGRMMIPMQNREKFDIEALQVFLAIKKHDAVDQYTEKLLNYWNERKYWLQHIANCHLAPPALIRHEGETGAEYLNRCFDASIQKEGRV